MKEETPKKPKKLKKLKKEFNFLSDHIKKKIDKMNTFHHVSDSN